VSSNGKALVMSSITSLGVRLIVEQPVHTLVTNVQGTETVLDYCARFGKRVLVASTSEVYGDHREEKPLSENDRRSEFAFVPYEEVFGQGIEDMLHRSPAIEKIRAAVGWTPTRDLDAILLDVIEYAEQAPAEFGEPAVIETP
jgi:nucleoside-diphosphate-sugar epimerase